MLSIVHWHVLSNHVHWHVCYCLLLGTIWQMSIHKVVHLCFVWHGVLFFVAFLMHLYYGVLWSSLFCYSLHALHYIAVSRFTRSCISAMVCFTELFLALVHMHMCYNAVKGFTRWCMFSIKADKNFTRWCMCAMVCYDVLWSALFCYSPHALHYIEISRFTRSCISAMVCFRELFLALVHMHMCYKAVRGFTRWCICAMLCYDVLLFAIAMTWDISIKCVLLTIIVCYIAITRSLGDGFVLWYAMVCFGMCVIDI